MATETAASTSTNGRVKWFNNKAGYGFISVNDCETKEERDIFVHHSEIRVGESQYKYLVQGEYVDFTISPIVREGKESTDLHATSVRGVNGGKLMCETRNEVRSQRTMPATQSTQRMKPQQRPHRQESRRPQLDKADQSEWMIVPRRRTESVAPASRPSQRQSKPPRQRQPEIEIQ